MKKGMKILGIALLAAALLTAGLSTTAFAAPPEDGAGTASGEGFGWRGEMGMGSGALDAVSELTGLTVDEIHDLRADGFSLAEIAADNDVAVNELVAAIMAGKTARINARVAAGTITQEQAELMIQNMEQRTLGAVNRTDTGPAEWRGTNGTNTGGMSGSMGARGQRGSSGTGTCTGTGTGSQFGNTSY